MSLAADVARLNLNLEMNSKAREFCNLARVVALAKGNPAIAQQITHDNRVLLGPRIQNIFESGQRVYEMARDMREKAAASAGTTADTVWALPLADYQTLASAFLESLKNFGAFDRMLGSMRRVPFRTRIGAVTTGATGTTVGQGAPKTISRLTLTQTQLDEIKVACDLVVTDELVRFSGNVAGNLFATELSNAVAVQTDATFVTELTSGATSIGSSGTTAEHTRNDLRAMLAAVTTNARSQLYLLMTSAIAKILAVLHDNTGGAAFPTMNFNGGTIGGVTALVSDGVSANTMLLVDAQQIAAASETIQLRASNQALVQMDTTPDSPPTGSTNLVSLWQNNWTALRAERFIGIEKLTSSGVAVLTGVAYIGDSPGP